MPLRPADVSPGLLGRVRGVTTSWLLGPGERPLESAERDEDEDERIGERGLFPSVRLLVGNEYARINEKAHGRGKGRRRRRRRRRGEVDEKSLFQLRKFARE